MTTINTAQYNKLFNYQDIEVPLTYLSSLAILFIKKLNSINKTIHVKDNIQMQGEFKNGDKVKIKIINIKEKNVFNKKLFTIETHIYNTHSIAKIISEFIK